MEPNVSMVMVSMTTDSPVASESDVGVGGNGSSVVKLSPPDYMYVYVTLCNVIMFVVGVLGNGMVIHVIVRMRALRSRVNYFLVSLAVADLLVLIVCQPSAMLAFYTRDQWILGYFMCKMVPFLEHWTLHASVLTLLVIGVERYFTICKPLAKMNSMRSSYTSLLIFPVWIIASLLALPFVFITDLEEVNYYDNSKVKICHTRVSGFLSRMFIVSSIGVIFLIPLVLLIFLYASVIRTLRRLSNAKNVITSCGNVKQTSSRRPYIHPTTAKSRRQVSRMMVAIVVLFFVSLLPLKILSLFLVFSTNETLEDLGFESYQNLLSVARLMTYVNSAGNPVIYAWMSPRFRRGFHLSAPKCRCWRGSTSKRGSFVHRHCQEKAHSPQAVY